MVNGTQAQCARTDANPTAQHLVQLAINGLPQMLDRQRQLFCYKLKKTARGLVQQGISPRYSAIALMGLHRLEQAGTPSPVPLDAVLESLLADLCWVDNIGDLGLLVWVCALVAPERLEELNRRLEVRSALSRYSDAKQGRTMELAWFLSGLCHWVLAQPEMQNRLRDQAYEAFRLLTQNQGTRVFAHLARTKSIRGMVRGRIGSFADQVYPIYALCKFYESYQERSALERAVVCAEAICQAQGPLGQWWWHYDSHTGDVFERYPVFSVHQHGMGPMTLFTLSQVSNTNFDHWVYKGVDWISRRNELSLDLEDTSASIIWRCIQPLALQRYSQALSHRSADLEARKLRVFFECRPYELGWLLYAFGSTPAINTVA